MPPSRTPLFLNAPRETVRNGQFHIAFGLQKYVFAHKWTEVIGDIPTNRSAQHLGVPFNRLGYKAGQSRFTRQSLHTLAGRIVSLWIMAIPGFLLARQERWGNNMLLYNIEKTLENLWHAFHSGKRSAQLLHAPSLKIWSHAPPRSLPRSQVSIATVVFPLFPLLVS